MASSSGDLSRYFKKGADIEISSDDEGFRGSWFAGKVLRPPKDCNKGSAKVLVQYRTLMEDDAGKRPLRENLKLVQLRPLPPRENRRSFQCSEDVDAYYNDGWWEGIVTEVLGDDKFLVFFRCSREQLVFKSSDLRLHREWVYGKWVPPLEETPDGMPEGEKLLMVLKLSCTCTWILSNGEDKYRKVSVSAEGEAKEVIGHNFCPEAYAEAEVNNSVIEYGYGPGDLVEVSGDEEGFEGVWFAAIVVKELNNVKYLVEYQYLKDQDGVSLLREETDNLHIRPRPPDVLSLDPFEVLEQVDALYNDGWWRGVVSKVLKDNQYSVYFPPTEEELKFEHAELRVHQEWINGKWVIASKVSCI